MNTSKNIQLLGSFKVNCLVDTKKSVSKNIKSFCSESAKKDRQNTALNANRKLNSLNNKVDILKNECLTISGLQTLDSNFLDITDITVKNVLNCNPAIIENNKKLLVKFVKVNEKNFPLSKTVDTKIVLSILDNGFLQKISDTEILFIKDKVEYTFIVIETFTITEILNRISKYKKQLLINQVSTIISENRTKLENEKIVADEIKKAAKLAKIENDSKLATEKELKRVENEAANVLKIEKLEKQLAKLTAKKAA